MIVASLVEYIECQLEKQLDLEGIAEKLGYSPYYLHRMFSQVAGLPLMSYVRKRKLASSLKLLSSTDLKVIDVALQFGFEYEQSFIRSFKDEFGITPHKYRKQGPRLDITSRLSVTDIEYLSSGMMLPPGRIFLPALKLIGLNAFITADDENYFNLPNQVAMQFLKKDAPLIKGEIDRDIYYAKIHYLDEAQTKTFYMPSFSYTDVKSYPESLSLASVGACEYVVFKYIGQHSPYEITMHHLKEIYEYIWTHFPDYLWKHCDMQNKLERLDDTICREDYCEMEFLFPLRQDDI